MKDIWSEQYRPDTLDNYVFIDENQEKQVRRWVKEGSIPHLLLSGAPGTGKTTLAKILKNELGVQDHDFLMIDGTRSSSIDVVREKIIPFAETMPFGDFKMILIDEADYLSQNSQGGLRGPLQDYYESVRFVLTCNYGHKIIPALKSRCQEFDIKRMDETEFTARVAEIMINEDVQFDIDILDTYVKATYPDLRKCINSVDQNTVDGVLQKPNQKNLGTSDYKIKAVELFKQGKIREGRKLVCESFRSEEADDMFRWMYDNLDLWASSDEDKDAAILAIVKGLRSVPLVSDQEINLAAVFVELANIQN